MISVIVPVYKVEPYLRRCIDSIIGQTYSDLEIILVDDGSPDRCGEICEEYAKKDSRIRVFHKQNGGLSDARNYGVKYSCGEYILFVDSDDFISADLVEYLYTILRKSNADVACCGHVKTSSDQADFSLVYSDYVVMEGGRDACQKQLTEFHFMTTAWAKLIKRELAENNPFPKGRNHEDIATTYRYYYNAKKVVVSRNKLYAYYNNPKSISNTFTNKNVIEILTAYEERLDFFEERKEWELYEIAQQSYLYDFLKYVNQFDLPHRDKRYFKTVFRNKRVSIRMKIFIGGMLCFGEWVTAVFSTMVRIVDWLQVQKTKILALVQCCRNIWQKEAVLLNTPEHGNVGDHAIAMAEAQLLSNCGIRCGEITGVELAWFKEILACLIPKSKAVYVHGGGYLGYLYPKEEARFRDILEKLPNHDIIVFPQTVTFDMNSEEGLQFFQESKRIYEGHKKLVLFVRERKSYAFMKENMPEVNVQLVPDVVTRLHLELGSDVRNGILLCMRNDGEKCVDSQFQKNIKAILAQKYPQEEQKATDTFIGGKISRTGRDTEVEKKLTEFKKCKLIVTDRLHGMVFAALTSTPCIAIDNSNGKVWGAYQWIRNNEYIQFVNTISEFEKALNNLDLDKTYSYDCSGLLEKFKPLEDALSR